MLRADETGLRLLLRLEGAAVLIASVAAYAWSGDSWWLFALLFLAPDLSMLGYLGGPRVGAWCYNAAHSYLLPLGVLMLGAGLGQPQAVAVGLVWTAHIGFDRALGYGLKRATSFRDTHLGRIGRDAG